MNPLARAAGRSIATALAFAITGAACSPSPSDSAKQSAAAPPAWFVDRAGESGLDFVHFNGMSGRLYYPEIMGPGVGVLDYDNDGDLDVYLVQGQMLGDGVAVGSAVFPPAAPLMDRLFRNDLVVHEDGRRTLRFTDVTAQSGLDVRTYGMGVATGDIDNDGRTDIYRTGLNGSVLLRNNGNGTFSDVTARSGTGNPGGWGVSASFFDFDRDGRLDLFVGNYLIYSTASDVPCMSVSGRRDYCPPNSYRAQPSRLYHNRGDGRFADVTARALAGGAYGPALGVSTADFDGDGWIDLYVANDGQANQLWINQRNGTFLDRAFLAGAAVSGSGNAEASMGIDAGDYDNDGDEDLFITNWLDQMNTIYVNDGSGGFEERKAATGLGPPSLAKTGFGTAWFDVDNDGWLDLFTANGGVATIEAQARAGDPFPLRMRDQLYRNRGDGRFDDVSARSGAVFDLTDVGRGVAVGDMDNDGDSDLIVGNAAGRTRLLINDTPQKGYWMGLRLVGTPGRRDMLGARIEVQRPAAPTLWRRVRSDGSYASANDPRVLVGLGRDPAPPRVRVHWPDGQVQDLAQIPIDRWTTVEQPAR